MSGARSGVLRSHRPTADAVAVRGAIDEPTDGRRVELRGWIDPVEAVDRVEVTVDGGRPEPARLHLLDGAGGTRATWAHTLDLRPGTAATIRAVAVAAGKRVPLGERVVEADPSPRTPVGEQRWARSLEARARLSARRHVAAQDGLHLLVAVPDFEHSSAQRWLLAVLRPLLGRSGVRCVVVGPEYGPVVDELEGLGATVHLTGGASAGPAAHASLVRQLVLLAGDEGCNAALANTLDAAVGIDVGSCCGIPAVLAVHGRWAAAGEIPATAVLVSPDADPRWRREGDERVLTMPAALETAATTEADRRAARAARGCADDDVVLLAAASDEEPEAPALAVLALARLAGAFPMAHLVAATEPRRSSAVLALGERLGLRDRVRVVPSAAPWYPAADGFVSAAQEVSQGREVVGAMAARLPVVATAVGGTPDLVDGRTGLLCPPRDIAALTEALDRLLGMSPRKRSRLARAAAARVEATGAAGPIQQVGNLLLELAAHPHASPRAVLGR